MRIYSRWLSMRAFYLCYEKKFATKRRNEHYDKNPALTQCLTERQKKALKTSVNIQTMLNIKNDQIQIIKYLQLIKIVTRKWLLRQLEDEKIDDQEWEDIERWKLDWTIRKFEKKKRIYKKIKKKNFLNLIILLLKKKEK